MFGSKPGRAALCYEKSAKEVTRPKKKKAAEAANKTEEDKAEAAEGAPKKQPIDGFVAHKLVLINVVPYF